MREIQVMEELSSMMSSKSGDQVECGLFHGRFRGVHGKRRMSRRLGVALLLALGMLLCVSSSGAWGKDQNGNGGAAAGFSLLDAVQMTLERDPNIQIAKQTVDIYGGQLQTSQGEFDVALSGIANDSTIHTPNDTLTRTSTGLVESVDHASEFQASISKKFRSGQTASLVGDVVRNEDLSENAFTQPINRSTVYFKVIQPLFKGRGVEASGANEQSAKIEYEASKLTYRRTVEERVYAAVQAYWQLAMAELQLRILKESEERSKANIARTQKLIEAAELPRVELDQLLADYERNKVSRIAGEQAVFQARNSLGQVMGLSINETSMLPNPSPPLDLFTPEATAVTGAPALYISLAMDHRADYASALKQEEAARVLLVAAKRNLEPQVDLSVSLGYAGLSEGSGAERIPGAFDQNPSGMNVQGGLTYYWPFANNEARGLLVQRNGIYTQRSLTARNMARTIEINIATDLSAIQKASEELKAYYRMRHYYETAVENEKKKFALGTSTLFNIINYEDSLTNASLSLVNGQVSLALAIASLRLETSTLIDFSDADNSITVENLTTLPRTEEK